MRTTASVNWGVSLDDDETFDIVAHNHRGRGGAPYTIQVARVRPVAWPAGCVSVEGPMLKKDGEPGLNSRKAVMNLDDERLPAKVRAEIERMTELHREFALAVGS